MVSRVQHRSVLSLYSDLRKILVLFYSRFVMFSFFFFAIPRLFLLFRLLSGSFSFFFFLLILLPPLFLPFLSLLISHLPSLILSP